MTEERKTELRELAERATAGKWEVGAMNSNPNDFTVFVADGMEYHQGGVILNQLDICRRMDGPNGRNNAEFIAAARTAVPELLDDVERLRARIERLESVCQQARIALEQHASGEPALLYPAIKALDAVLEETESGAPG